MWIIISCGLSPIIYREIVVQSNSSQTWIEEPIGSDAAKCAIRVKLLDTL